MASCSRSGTPRAPSGQGQERRRRLLWLAAAAGTALSSGPAAFAIIPLNTSSTSNLTPWRPWDASNPDPQLGYAKRKFTKGRPADMPEDPRWTSKMILESTSAASLLKNVKPHMEKPFFNEIHLVIFTKQLLRHRFTITEEVLNSPILARILLKIREFLKNGLFSSQQIAMVWTRIDMLKPFCPAVKELTPDFAKATYDKVKWFKQDFSTFTIVHLLIASASSVQNVKGREQHIIVRALADKVMELKADFTPQDAIYVLQAAVRYKARYGAMPQLMKAASAMAEIFPKSVKDMNPTQLSQAMFAIANLKDEVPSLLPTLESLVKQVDLRMVSMEPPNLAGILGAGTLVHDSHPELLSRILPELSAVTARRFKYLQEGDYSRLIRGFAILGSGLPETQKLVQSLTTDVTNKAANFSAGALADIAVAVVSTPEPHLPALEAVAKAAMARAEEEWASFVVQLPAITWAVHKEMGAVSELQQIYKTLVQMVVDLTVRATESDLKDFYLDDWKICVLASTLSAATGDKAAALLNDVRDELKLREIPPAVQAESSAGPWAFQRAAANPPEVEADGGDDAEADPEPVEPERPERAQGAKAVPNRRRRLPQEWKRPEALEGNYGKPFARLKQS